MVAIVGNKWRRGSLAWFGISSQPYGCQPATGKGTQNPGKRNDFLGVLWVAVCSEGVSGVVTAARCVMGLCSQFWHCSTLLLRSLWWWCWGDREVTARCAAEGRFESGNLGTALKVSSPHVLVCEGGHVLCSTPIQAAPSQISCCVSQQ